MPKEDTQFKQGQSGNPNGRPKMGEAMTDILRSKVSKEEMADKLIAMAKAGDIKALIYIYDRIDGKPGQSISFEGEVPLSNLSTEITKLREEYAKNNTNSTIDDVKPEAE